jgi:hypothetical protein
MNVKLIRPDNGQKADMVALDRGMVQLRTYDTVTPATRWYTLQSVQVCNPTVHVAGIEPQNFDSGLLHTCADQPRTLAIWRPTIELPIWELGYYREGSKQKAIPGVNLTMCNVRIVLTLPEAA